MRRLLIVVAVLLAAPFVFVSPASASTRIAQQSWADTGAVPTAVPEEGRLYVAATAGQEDARAFVRVDTAGLDDRSLRSATLVLVEAGDSLLTDQAVVAACLLKSGFSRDGQLESDAVPEVDCGVRVDAIRDPSGRWTVDLGVFADHWASGSNYGLALFPDHVGPATTWRLAFVAEESDVVLSGASGPATGTPPLTLSTPEVTPNLEPLDWPGPVAAGTVPRPTAGGGPAKLPANAEVSALPAAGSAASPPAWPFVLGLAVVAAIATIATPLRRRIELPPRLRGERGRGRVVVGAAVALSFLPLLGSEVTVFRAGLVLTFLVAALGLHVLVNWAGQLSLAHAGMIGLPAFVVLAISDGRGVSPIYLLPVAAAIGAAVGGVVALPTLRAKGVHVALVTLVAGIAIDRFFFTKPWLVGDAAGRTAAVPRIGPVEFTTSRSLYPVLVVVVALAGAATWALLHSKVARAWFWVRQEPAAAAAFGVPVVGYRIFAFTVGGALAGLAGGMFAMWSQRLTAQSFPTELSFSYLLAVILAGPGFIGGLVVAALVIAGGPLFFSNLGTIVDYLGPAALIFNITHYESGFNGAGRDVMERLRARGIIGREPVHEHRLQPIGLAMVTGVVAITAGFVAISLAWYHAGNTDELWRQNQELISGGVGGLALVILGTGLLIRDRLGRNEALLAHHLAELQAQRETTDTRELPWARDQVVIGTAPTVSALRAQRADQRAGEG